MKDLTAFFESQRPQLFRVAYGMLGRVAPAEDAVQEAFIRWQNQDPQKIKSHQAFLTTVVSRICLDEMKSARNHREKYIGPDLPEPVLTTIGEKPDEILEMAESLSMAMLMLLKQLSPLERAVFILREVFSYDYASISEILHKSTSHCRKIAQKARHHMAQNKPRFDSDLKSQKKLVDTFVEAVESGDLSGIEQTLAEEAILYSDGGGKVTAARNPIYSATKIAKFVLGIRKMALTDVDWSLEMTNFNGEPGMILWKEGQIYNAWSFHVENDKISSIYIVLNPDKLEHLRKD